MTTDFANIRERVERLLADFPATRDNDKLLTLAYLCVHHGLKEAMGEYAYLRFKEIFLSPSVPTVETIRRRRQEIQEAGLYRGDEYQERQQKAKGETIAQPVRSEATQAFLPLWQRTDYQSA